MGSKGNAGIGAARTFGLELYGQAPAGLIALSSKNGRGWGPTSVVSTLEDFISQVAGAVDVYARITLIGDKPARGRGTEADSIAMPGVWTELDINGSPNGRGGTVTGGFEALDAAIDFAGRLLEPTMLVCSGYGLHAYWIFEEPLVDLQLEERRREAKAVVRGWQEVHKRIALEELGIRKLDATFDLARVFRPPGSFNGKGVEPQSVELLAHTGAHYALEQIHEYALAREDPPRSRSRSRTRVPRAVTKLLEDHPRLQEIARRKGKAPGDGSASDWDYYLGCEARRVASATSAEVAELIRHARGLHGDDKGERADYVERTVDAVFVAEPHDGDEAGDDATPLGTQIARAWNLETKIVAGHTIGYGDAASVYLHLDDGRELRFPRLAELFDPSVHARRVSLIARSRCPHLGKPRALEIAQWVVELCDAEVDPTEDLDETEGWVTAFRSGLGTVTPGELRTPGDVRWAALLAVADFTPDREIHREVAGRTAAIRDGDGRLWLPAEAFMRHVRFVERASIDWGTLSTRMKALGWTRHKVGAREPGVPQESARRIRLSFFVEEEPDRDR
jgi:hypothetical protein